jgi:hypothetical protein
MIAYRFLMASPFAFTIAALMPGSDRSMIQRSPRSALNVNGRCGKEFSTDDTRGTYAWRGTRASNCHDRGVSVRAETVSAAPTVEGLREDGDPLEQLPSDPG